MASRIICTTAAIILISGIQFLAGTSGNPVLILMAGALLCLAPYGFWLFLDAEDRSQLDYYLPGLASVTGIFLGSLARWMAQPSGTWGVDLLAVIICAVGSGTIIILRLRQRAQRCKLCGHYLTRHYQHCPRCAEAVCGRSHCWNDEYYRCSDCEWLRRPVLPLDDQHWWFERTGPRVGSGACLKCKQDAGVCDLRNCGVCPWSMCTKCWDFENGRCLRCHWMMPDLPQALHAYLSVDGAGLIADERGRAPRRRQ